MNNEISTNLYKSMFLIRRTEEMLLDLFGKGELFGTIHTSLGQEAIAVGVLSNIDISKDLVFSNHRCHGHFLSIFKDPRELFSEIMGKKSGVCRGVGGSQHIQKGNFYTNGIQGGMFPIAAGSAFVEKTKNTDSIVVSFIGDGTLGQGVVYETLNLISLLNLPILVVIENNQYAQSTSIKQNLAGSILTRINAFGIEAKEINGNSALEVYEQSGEIISKIRQFRKPFALIANTYRLGPHSKGDDTRDPQEIQEHKKQDPLIIFEKNLDEDSINKIKQEVEQQILEAVEFARNSERLLGEEFLERINKK